MLNTFNSRQRPSCRYRISCCDGRVFVPGCWKKSFVDFDWLNLGYMTFSADYMLIDRVVAKLRIAYIRFENISHSWWGMQWLGSSYYFWSRCASQLLSIKSKFTDKFSITAGATAKLALKGWTCLMELRSVNWISSFPSRYGNLHSVLNDLLPSADSTRSRGDSF